MLSHPDKRSAEVCVIPDLLVANLRWKFQPDEGVGQLDGTDLHLQLATPGVVR